MYDFADLSPAIKFYASLVDFETIVRNEYRLWREKFKDAQTLPNNAIQAIHLCSSIYFPNIYKLLQILCTLPVTTASNERTFSSLKFLKNYLRSSMNDNRLNGLALLYVNKKFPMDVDSVIDRFSRENRRLDFLL